MILLIDFCVRNARIKKLLFVYSQFYHFNVSIHLHSLSHLRAE